MNKLLVAALSVVCLSLGLEGPAPAASMVEYSQLASQNQGGGATVQKSGSWKSRQGRAKKSKAKG
jgi:hypothetical protein